MIERTSLDKFYWEIQFWQDDILLAHQKIHSITFDITDQWMTVPLLEPQRIAKHGVTRIVLRKLEEQDHE